jgi:hypothetical protein
MPGSVASATLYIMKDCSCTKISSARTGEEIKVNEYSPARQFLAGDPQKCGHSVTSTTLHSTKDRLVSFNQYMGNVSTVSWNLSWIKLFIWTSQGPTANLCLGLTITVFVSGIPDRILHISHVFQMNAVWRRATILLATNFVLQNRVKILY